MIMARLSGKKQYEKSGAWLLIFISWVVYTTSTLGKINYSANITQIIDFYGITKAQAGIAPTFFFFAYGIGQVFNGIFCKKYNIKWMVFASLFTSATVNLIIAITTNFMIIKWLWMLNGFALSILWPSLIRLLSEKLSQRSLGKSSVIIGTTVAAGTLIVYGLSSLYVAFDMFKLAFYTAAVLDLSVAVGWILIYKKAVKMSLDEKLRDDNPKVNSQADLKQEETGTRNKIFYVSIYALCFCAVGVNLTKDGLTTWVPSILKEEYAITDSLSILLTLLLPVVAIFGNMFALYIHKKIPDYVTHCAASFALMFVFIGIIIGSLTLKLVALMLIGLIVVSFLASSLNSLITSVFPMFMRGKVNSGLYAGVLNGFCYVGSTISSYGLGSIADKFGWTAVFWTLLVFCVLVCIIWGAYSLLKRMFKSDLA